MKTIDLNCDMGESFGAWQIGNDAAIMPYITSANIACGFHAGDASIMRQTCELAIKHNVAIGAHPSFPDLQGFGRRIMQLSSQEVYDICIYQIGALYSITKTLGNVLHHVKPHGALYNIAAKDPAIATAIASATKAIDPNLILYGLSGSFLISEAEKIGLKTASEVFADRTYQDDGSLTPRNLSNALIKDSKEAINQVLMMVLKQKVLSVNNVEVRIKADSVCIHGDSPSAFAFVRGLTQAFDEHQISKVGYV